MNRYTVNEIADMLGCSIYPIRKAINKGELKSDKIGQTYLVPSHELYRWMLQKEHYTFSPTDEQRLDLIALLDDLADGHPVKKTLIEMFNPVKVRPKKSD